MSSTITYLYCVVAADALAALGPESPAGIDGAAVHMVTEAGVTALVSALADPIYQSDDVTPLLGDVTWVTPRAVAHDRVVTWASDHTAVVPLPMWTLLSSDDAVRARLREHANAMRAQLTFVQGAREYVVRVFASTEQVSASLGALDDTIGALERAAQTASPGQAYLLQRKLDAARKTDVRATMQRVADDVLAVLTAHSVDTVRDPLPVGEKATHAVLNAACLVRDDGYDAFRAALTVAIDRYQSSGFGFEFTGPWPPYHFLRGR